MKKACSLLFSIFLFCICSIPASLAATLQSNQAVYLLSLDPVGTEPFSYVETESHATTLLPLGTTIRHDGGYTLLVESFSYQQESGLWVLDSTLHNLKEFVLQDQNHIYHISTLSPGSTQSEKPLDRGIWIKGAGDSAQPVTITGELVDDWALDLVNQAIANDLMPQALQTLDLRQSITRAQFADLTVQLYEVMSGQMILLPSVNPFTDTQDPAVLKAYSMGFVLGKSDTSFAPQELLNREQAATMLTAVYRQLGGTVPAAETLPFRDQNRISAWARDSIAFMAGHQIIQGYDNGQFGPQDSTQRQAALIMALRMYHTLSPQ